MRLDRRGGQADESWIRDFRPIVSDSADVHLRYIGAGMGTTDVEREYSELLAQERSAWATLRQNMQGGEYDPALLAEWLAIGRKCEVARQRMIDAVLQDDPGVMHRPMPRA